VHWVPAWNGTTFNLWSHESTSSTKDIFTCSASIFWYISLAIPQINITLIPCNCYVCWHILNYCNWERNSEVARSSRPYLLRVMTHARLKVHSSKERTISLLNQASWHALWMVRVKLTSNHTSVVFSFWWLISCLEMGITLLFIILYCLSLVFLNIVALHSLGIFQSSRTFVKYVLCLCW